MSPEREAAGPPVSPTVTAPAFSILMPAYGTESYIAEAIESVIDQSRADWELLVVDDGSPDRLADVVSDYLADPRVRLIRQRNAGVGGALNRAIAESSAPYVVKLDSDDALLPHYLQTVADVLDERYEVGFVACDAYVLDEANGRVRRRTYLGAAGRDGRRLDARLARLLEQNVIFSVATIRRTMLRGVGGFDEDRQIIEDWDLWLRLVAAGVNVAFVDQPLAIYRVRFPSASRDETGAYRGGPRVEHTLRKAMAELDLDPAERVAAERSLNRNRAMDRMGSARRALLRGDAKCARRMAREAHALSPSFRTRAIVAGLMLAPGIVRVSTGCLFR